MYVYFLVSPVYSRHVSLSDSRSDPRPTYVDFRILESLLEILVDRLVRDLADECQIGHSNLLLLRALKDSLPHSLRLGAIAATLALAGLISPPTRAFRYTLDISMSVWVAVGALACCCVHCARLRTMMKTPVWPVVSQSSAPPQHHGVDVLCACIPDYDAAIVV